ncbi:hypothetical protein B0H10DRAFT_2201541 [Mycena sp. CBHHK59/15]|nr:hypothetical protein B0H10DRAFT_2201541 [Mycena sp. CBHHK59/15]
MKNNLLRTTLSQFNTAMTLFRKQGKKAAAPRRQRVILILASGPGQNPDKIHLGGEMAWSQILTSQEDTRRPVGRGYHQLLPPTRSQPPARPQMPPEVFEIHDPPLRPFDPALWIGKNKKFPAEDAHPEVHAAFAEFLKMPESHASLVPGPNLPITAFLELALPQKSSAMVFSTPESWFSKDAPTAEVDCLRSRSIPPRQFLDDLTKKAGQAWLDGRTSIVDHRYNDGHDRLPFWSLTLWKEWLRVVDDQKMWRKSRDWITSELSKPNLGSVDEEALMTASSLLDTLGGWTTFNLALILSHAWLSDDHIDMMMADLSARVEADPELAAKVLITPLAFSNAVKDRANKKTYKREDTPLLARYEEHIKRTGVAQLYFPLHINNNHWIAGLVDFKQGLIGTGDSRVNSSRPPTKFIKDLKRWLKKQFGRDFVYQGDSLEHGDQKDTSSCSVVCRNTIAMNVFGEALWEQKHAAGARATCFIRLVRSAAIRKKKIVVFSKPQPELTAETPAEVSIAVALGDHNFPDLAEFALDIPARQSRPTLADLMNPAPATAGIADPLPADIEMPDAIPSVNTSSYAGDHGDVVPDDESADEQDPHEDDGKDMMDVRPKKANGTGTSKSAASAQKTRDALKSGELTVATADKTRYAAWQETLRTGKKGNGKNADPHVKFHPTDVKKARHSLCGTWVTMGEVYEAGRWNQHFKTACTALHPGKKMKIGDGLGGVPTLQSMGWMKGKSSSALRKPKLSVPCPGLTAATCPRLPVYLKRTGASGGGARSLTVIAKELFGRLARFSGLKAKEQDVVADTQRHERQWINDHAKQRVFSTNCKKQVLAGGLDGSRVLPCSECSSILGNSRFKQAIRLPIPADENYLYVNDKYRNQELAHIYARTVGLKEIIETADAKNTPCIKFAQGTLQGKYSDYKVFSGLVEAVVQKADRVERGVGMQNFKYAPAWDEMAHIINIHSPRAADALREHIPLRSHRTFRIGSWFSDAAEALDELEEPVDSEEEFDNEEPSTCEAEELQALIDGEERLDAPVRSAQVDREFTKLAFATIAISVDDHMRVHEFQETDEDLAEEILGDEHITLQETLASLPSEASKPFGRGTNTAFGNLDFKALVRQRKEHQTRQAANCARIKHTNPDESLPVSEESTRRQILRKYHELLKEDQARAVGTAVERKARWGTDPKPTAGNAANAAAAASAVATRAATRRTKLFKDAKLTARHLALVTNAGLTHFTQLAVGDFGIVWTELGLRVGKVETLYTKGGGKNGKHGAVTQHHNISAFSYIGVQVFELAHARQFRAIPQATSFLYTHQFRQLPPFTFLCRLTGKPDVNAVGLELSPDDANLFKDLNSGINSINIAVKLSKSRKKAAELDAEEDTTEDF